MSYFSIIDRALRSGARLHAFRSGGGLRVVRLEKSGELVGYGEHPQVEDALSHTAEDFEAGGRPYEEVYGGAKPHYLTGSLTPSSPLDTWLLKGSTFDAFVEGDDVVVEMHGYEHTTAPDDVKEKAKTGPVQWRDKRGNGYHLEPFQFPGNGEWGFSMKCIEKMSKADAYLYPIVKTGRASKLSDAIAKAIEAEAKEAPGSAI